MRPGFFQRVELHLNFAAKPLAHAVTTFLGVFVERPPAFDRQGIGALLLEVSAGEMQPRQGLSDSRAVGGTGPSDPQSIEKSHDRRGSAGDLAENPALAVLHR